MVTRRKVFISFHQRDREEVQRFVQYWAEERQLFIPKVLRLSDDDVDIINSNNAEYTMSQIRARYLGDSTVTMVLVGSCTHSRRYVDWELKASLRSGDTATPNGVMGVILPSQGRTADLPPRLEANWEPNNVNCYARYWVAPSTDDEIRGWIEDAHAARTSREHLIQNSRDMMRYNAKCNLCGITH